MRAQFHRTLLFCLALPLCCVLLAGAVQGQKPAQGPAPGETRTLTIVATSDLKGIISTQSAHPGKRAALQSRGLAHLAPVIARLRAEDPDLLLLDAGDAFVGSPLMALSEMGWADTGGELPRGIHPQHLMADALRALRYDAITLGNRDMALGWPMLSALRERMEMPWLAANLPPEGDPHAGPPQPFAGHALFTRKGLRIAVVGLTTPALGIGLPPESLRGHLPTDLTEATRRQVAHLQATARPDVIIGLFHSGLNADYAREEALRAGRARFAGAGEAADTVPGLHLVISGDSHRRGPRGSGSRGLHDAHHAPTLEPGALGRSLGVARLRLEKHRGEDQGEDTPGAWQVVAVRRETLDAARTPDPAIMAMARPAMDLLRDRLSAPTGLRLRRIPFRHKEFPPCLGALAHRAITQAATAQLATDGAAQYSLVPAGWRFEKPARAERGRPITRGHLYRWMPFAEPMLRVMLYPRQAQIMLEGHLRRERGWRVPEGHVLWPGGLFMEIPTEGSEPGPLRDAATMRLLEPERRHPFWLGSYHWHGGGGMRQQALLPPAPPMVRVSDAPQAVQLKAPLREVLFGYLRAPGLPLPDACTRWLEPIP